MTSQSPLSNASRARAQKTVALANARMFMNVTSVRSALDRWGPANSELVSSANKWVNTVSQFNSLRRSLLNSEPSQEQEAELLNGYEAEAAAQMAMDAAFDVLKELARKVGLASRLLRTAAVRAYSAALGPEGVVSRTRNSHEREDGLGVSDDVHVVEDVAAVLASAVDYKERCLKGLQRLRWDESYQGSEMDSQSAHVLLGALLVDPHVSSDWMELMCDLLPE